MRIHISSDHAGFATKTRVIARLRELGHEPIDCGPSSFDPEDDYPPYVIDAAERTVATPGTLGRLSDASPTSAVMAGNCVGGTR